MKSIWKLVFSLVFVLAAALPVCAREHRSSLVNLRGSGIQGYGGPHFRGTSINGGFGLFGGGPVQLLFKDSWSVGMSVSYLESDVNGLMVGYGGVRGEYIFFPRKLVHFSFGMFTGGGSAVYKEDRNSSPTASGILVVESEAVLILNLTDSMRLGLVSGFRYAHLLKEVMGLSDASTSGFFIGLNIQQGLFNQSEVVFHTGGSRLGTASFYTAKLTMINGRPCIMDGGGTLMLIDNRYYIGVNGFVARGDVTINGNGFHMMQGGLFFEYCLFPYSVASLSVGGPVSYAMAVYQDKQTGDMVGSSCALIEPEVADTFNITEFAQFRLGAGYRIGIGFAGVEGLSSINSPVLSIAVRFGEFTY